VPVGFHNRSYCLSSPNIALKPFVLANSIPLDAANVVQSSFVNSSGALDSP
jgi:hypothetical protein